MPAESRAILWGTIPVDLERHIRRKQMGRPLNKKYFGTPTAGGNEIKVQFWNGSASANGWIVKQLGSKKFRCTDGTATEDCVLVDADSADITAGQMTITVLDDTGTARQVTKISGKRVTLDTGASIAWNFSTSTTDAKVQMEEAGDDGDQANADDFEGDVTP